MTCRWGNVNLKCLAAWPLEMSILFDSLFIVQINQDVLSPPSYIISIRLASFVEVIKLFIQVSNAHLLAPL